MNRFGITRLTVSAIWCLLAAAMISATDNVAGQDKTTTTQRGATVLIRDYNEIPEATEECSPAEKQWWDNLRQAGNKFQQKLDKKSHTQFAVLFSEGVEKGYRVPLKDRPPQVLDAAKPAFPASLMTRLRTYHRKADIELLVEYRADGSIGEVKVVKGFNKEMDAYVVQAARETIFIPAVKDGAFVATWRAGGVKFSTQR